MSGHAECVSRHAYEYMKAVSEAKDQEIAQLKQALVEMRGEVSKLLAASDADESRSGPGGGGTVWDVPGGASESLHIWIAPRP